MKTNKIKIVEEDNELKSLVKNLKLESPGPNFTVKIMNLIFQENSVLERIKRERVLGKGFWIILILFVLLMVAVIAVTVSGISGGSDIPQLLGSINTNEVTQEYNSFFSILGTVPVSIAGILLASSILLFIERIISSKTKAFSK